MVMTMVALRMGFKDWRLLRTGSPSLWGWGQVPGWRLEPPQLLPTTMHCKHPGGSVQSTACYKTQANSRLKR